MIKAHFAFYFFSLSAFFPLDANEKKSAPSTDMVIKTYPAAVQKNYALFREKCSQCHSLSAPLKSDDVLPSYWQKTVSKMQKKSGSDISPEEAQQIYEFLVYDSNQRRKADLDAQISSLSPEKQKQEQDILAQIKKKYD